MQRPAFQPFCLLADLLHPSLGSRSKIHKMDLKWIKSYLCSKSVTWNSILCKYLGHNESLMTQRGGGGWCVYLCAACLHRKDGTCCTQPVWKGSRNVSSLNQYSLATVWVYWCCLRQVCCRQMVRSRKWEQMSPKLILSATTPAPLLPPRHFVGNISFWVSSLQHPEITLNCIEKG